MTNRFQLDDELKLLWDKQSEVPAKLERSAVPAPGDMLKASLLAIPTREKVRRSSGRFVRRLAVGSLTIGALVLLTLSAGQFGHGGSGSNEKAERFLRSIAAQSQDLSDVFDPDVLMLGELR